MKRVLDNLFIDLIAAALMVPTRGPKSSLRSSIHRQDISLLEVDSRASADNEQLPMDRKLRTNGFEVEAQPVAQTQWGQTRWTADHHAINDSISSNH